MPSGTQMIYPPSPPLAPSTGGILESYLNISLSNGKIKSDTLLGGRNDNCGFGSECVNDDYNPEGLRRRRGITCGLDVKRFLL